MRYLERIKSRKEESLNHLLSIFWIRKSIIIVILSRTNQFQNIYCSKIEIFIHSVHQYEVSHRIYVTLKLCLKYDYILLINLLYAVWPI